MRILPVLMACLIALAQAQSPPEPQMAPEVTAALARWRQTESLDELRASFGAISPGAERTTQILLAACETRGEYLLRSKLGGLLAGQSLNDGDVTCAHIPLLARLSILTVEDPYTGALPARIIGTGGAIQWVAARATAYPLNMSQMVLAVDDMPALVGLRKLYDATLAAEGATPEQQAAAREGLRLIDEAEARIRQALADGTGVQDWEYFAKLDYLLPHKAPPAGSAPQPSSGTPTANEAPTESFMARHWEAWALGVFILGICLAVFRHFQKKPRG